MSTPWKLFDNPFANATAGSYRKAVAISTFHDTALQVDSAGSPFISAIYTIFHPLNVALVAAYNAWKAQIQLQGGDVGNFNDLMDNMPDNINAYDASIQTHYAKKTTRYKALFPHAHKPFLNGTTADRISALNSLVTAIGTDAALASVKAAIVLYESNLNTALGNKSSSKQTTGNTSDAVETARVNMVASMLSSYGKMLDHFNTNPQVAAKYFDEHNLRNTLQVDFRNNHQPVLSIHHIVKRGFENSVQIEVENNGNDHLQVYLSDQPNGAVATIFVDAPPHTTAMHPINEFGDYNLNHFLNIYNPSATELGSWAIHIL